MFSSSPTCAMERSTTLKRIGGGKCGLTSNTSALGHKLSWVFWRSNSTAVQSMLSMSTFQTSTQRGVVDPLHRAAHVRAGGSPARKLFRLNHSQRNSNDGKVDLCSLHSSGSPSYASPLIWSLYWECRLVRGLWASIPPAAPMSTTVKLMGIPFARKASKTGRKSSPSQRTALAPQAEPTAYSSRLRLNCRSRPLAARTSASPIAGKSSLMLAAPTCRIEKPGSSSILGSLMM
mmetsp:Transcript_26841/g.72834  ORF Transcript_26841/g.72834 Transcript_26841/m.72834 type:complete len:233 (-) Transcript_26841:39-737(-)